MIGLAKVVGSLASCSWDFLNYVLLFFRSSGHVTHSSLGKILQYTPIIESEEAQKQHKTKTNKKILKK